jgi:hypothetical protein
VPVAIHNNLGGRDAEVLRRYDEPSWNYPVMRFLDADGVDVLERRDRIWTTHAVATRLAEALAAAGEEAPSWLGVVLDESAAGPLETASYTMSCYWQGEAVLGGVDGVVTTRAGWLGGAEAVEVTYDPRRVDRAALDAHAATFRCRAAEAAPDRDAKRSDRHYHLRRSPLRFVPLTPMQRTKVNAALGLGQDTERWLSPRQREQAARIRRVLERDDDALDGLEPATTLADLPAYARSLATRLSGE